MTQTKTVVEQIKEDYKFITEFKSKVKGFDKVALINAEPYQNGFKISNIEDVSQDFDKLYLLAENHIKNPVKYEHLLDKSKEQADAFHNYVLESKTVSDDILKNAESIEALLNGLPLTSSDKSNVLFYLNSIIKSANYIKNT